MIQPLLWPAVVDISSSNTTLQIWYEASASAYQSVNNFNTTVTNGTQITQWSDRSAGAHNANVDGGANKPTWNTSQQNSLGALVFASGKKLSINPFSTLSGVSNFTIFAATLKAEIGRAHV